MPRLSRLLFVFAFLLITAPISAQTGQRTASPPVVTVELSGIEPRPSNFPAEMQYGGLGGGGGEFITPNGIYWSLTPGVFQAGYNAYFSACGYTNLNQLPTATLTYPGGSTVQLGPNQVDTSGGCVDYEVPWQYGMELGVYSLVLNHANGQISQTWGMDYPFCQTAVKIDNVDWLMGYAPNEQLTIVFFAAIDFAEPVFAAVRNVQADTEGTLVMDVQVSRSAPFTAEELLFAVIGPQRELYYPPSGFVDTSGFESLGYVRPSQPVPPPRYPNYYTTSGLRDIGFSGCEGEYDRFVEIAPFNGSGSIPLFADVNSSSVVGQIASGAPAEIIEQRPAITNGRVAIWKHLRAEDGTTGWNASLDFVNINAYLLPGSRVESAQMGIYDEQQQIYRPTNPMLFDAPSSQARPVTDLPVGTPMTAYGYRVVGDGRWWFARTDDGRAGWLPESDPVTYNYTMTPFPWQPVPVNETGAVWQTCPGSPATRLVPYISGRVTPGDPNRIRAEPESGSVIGEIPAGATFYINDGPVCGSSNGLTWWNVRYNETVGWTAEGQGDTYWLEPVAIQ